jgi:uncharacterized protein YukE
MVKMRLCPGFPGGWEKIVKEMKMRLALREKATDIQTKGSTSPPALIAMSQAIIDPEEVRRFAAELKRFNGDLRERTGSLMARFTALGDTWQDQEQEKFAAEFTQLMKTLKSFLELSDRHTPYLLRKAERIQQYLDQR